MYHHEYNKKHQPEFWNTPPQKGKQIQKVKKEQLIDLINLKQKKMVKSNTNYRQEIQRYFCL